MKLPKITFFSILFFIFSTAVYSQTDFLIVNDNPNPASAQMMRRSLLDLGRMVDLVEFSSHDPAIYDGYNVVIWSAGNNDANIFNDATKREALVQRAISEKKVWVEGGEVGFYYSSSADSAFRKKVLHIQEWYNDGVTSSLQFIVPSHPIFTIVTGLASPIVFSGSDPKDRDVMRTLPNDEGRVRLGNWSGLGNDTSLMGINEWSTSPNQVTTHTLFTSFNVTAIADSEVAKSFIRNVGVYMLIPDNDPTLILYSPMSREIWQENTPQIIRWAKNRVSYVRLEYKLVGEPEWTLIADSVPAFRLDENGDRHYEFNENGEIVGLFEWTVPEIATLDTGAHVRVSSIDDPNLNAVNPLPFYISEYPAPHWSLRPSATSAQGRLMSTYIQVGDTGFVYAMGGGENSGSNLNQRYNTRTGQWVRKDTLRLKSSTGGAV
ncbi:MAG: hypothetical protein KGZ58_13815, partial [Ignavibacteriales bacterium]|nr:hypothetical protein [Ignavibacteriales bacterium]